MAIIARVEDVYLKRRIPRKEFVTNKGFPYTLPIKFTDATLPPIPTGFPYKYPIDFNP